MSPMASDWILWSRQAMPRVLSQIARAALAVGALAGMMVNHEPSLSLIATTRSLIIFGVLLLTSYILSLTETPFSGLISVRPGHLAVRQHGRTLVIDDLRIRSALVVDRPGFAFTSSTVEIELVNGDIFAARVLPPSAADGLVEALGLGPGGGGRCAREDHRGERARCATRRARLPDPRGRALCGREAARAPAGGHGGG